MSNRGFRGFTLAEVLITLGAIGVVAAMTMPVLFAKYNNHITETRLKKFYSTFNQAIVRSEVDNGDKSLWDFNVRNVDASVVDEKFQKYLAPYMNIIETKDITSKVDDKTRRFYFFADGSSFSFNNIKSNEDIAFYPKNPEKCLNREDGAGICYFLFLFVPNQEAQSEYTLYSSNWKGVLGKGLEPHLYSWNGEEDDLYNNEQYGCKTIGAFCTALIQHNGWKVPKDYPKKLAY